MLNYDQCASLRFARRLAAELGVDPARRGSARLAARLADTSVPGASLGDLPQTRTLHGDGFTLLAHAEPVLTDDPIVTLTDAVPMARWLQYVPAGVAGMDEQDILGPIE